MAPIAASHIVPIDCNIPLPDDPGWPGKKKGGKKKSRPKPPFDTFPQDKDPFGGAVRMFSSPLSDIRRELPLN